MSCFAWRFGIPASEFQRVIQNQQLITGFFCGIFNSNKTSKPAAVFFQGVPKEKASSLSLMKFRRCSHVVHVVLPPV